MSSNSHRPGKSDAQLRREVGIEVRCDARLGSASRLVVQVRGGVVTLRGLVATTADVWQPLQPATYGAPFARARRVRRKHAAASRRGAEMTAPARQVAPGTRLAVGRRVDEWSLPYHPPRARR